MRLGKRNILGLDIGTHSIKVVEVKRTKNGPTVTFAHNQPIVPIGDSENAKEEATREALETLVSEGKLRKRRVAVAVPSALDEQVTMRSIFVPELPIDAPKEVLRLSVQSEFEAQDYIPYNDEAEIGFHVEGQMTLNGVNGLAVFVVAVHRDLIEQRVALLKECGLSPVAIDVDFLALVRLACVTQQLAKTGDTVLLDIGASKTTIGFYQQRKLYLYPHIPMAGNQLTAQLAERLDTDWEEAEKCKRTQTEEPHIWETLEACLDQDLYQQLYVHFDAYEREFPDSKPAKVIVSGGTAQLSRLDHLFDSRFAIPVDVLHYLDKIPVESNEATVPLRGNEPLFATAVGLALKEV